MAAMAFHFLNQYFYENEGKWRKLHLKRKPDRLFVWWSTKTNLSFNMGTKLKQKIVAVLVVIIGINQSLGLW